VVGVISSNGNLSPEDWPFDPNEFVSALELADRGATDEEVRVAIEAIEDDTESYQEWLDRKNVPHVSGFVEEVDES